MKTQKIILAIALYAATCFPPFGVTKGGFCQTIGINSTGAAGNASSGLDIDFTDRGLLIPRMTTAQRNAIVLPANSLLIFNTDNSCFQAYINSVWQNTFCDLGCTAPPASPGIITGNATPCQTGTGVTYSIAQVAGATSYNWTVPAGASITAGQGTTGIVVTFGMLNGNISVTASNNCGISAAQTIAISLIPLTTGVTASAGPNPICEGATLTLTGGATGATIWSWTGPNAFSSSLQSPTIANITTAGAGTYTLTAGNACGSAAPVSTSAVTVSTNPPPVPTATPATNVSATGFNANWTAVTGAITYYLDVSSDNFSTYILQNQNVGNFLTYYVTANVFAATHFYRVRSETACGTSAYSNTITITVTTVTYNYTGGMQYFTVPAGVASVTVEAFGAQGGTSNACGEQGGLGARMKGTFAVSPGQVANIMVGGQGGAGTNGGGGGGTFVTDAGNNPVIIAGGGGGAYYCGYSWGSGNMNGTIGTSGLDGSNGAVGAVSGAGGAGPNGGGTDAGYGNCGAGGGGHTGNGADAIDYQGIGVATGGQSFVNGGAGGWGIGSGGNGGYGGGGGADWNYWTGGGGGGGYGGGGGGTYYGCGGGGGSYNSGTNQSNSSGVNSGNGKVTIQYVN